ncbi:kinase-like protein [Guyanagaster necrorhizus]|uniref:Kinase-like protein n=1 Tax=Guyanagaster necrorhizus TaxID=856835 RepID=A0A9P7VH15_9AGAR|nr:kinase-like protein [Guyanagaster necrorhizus MCA 3950]KAG7439931.1 kinase-like protein [Guyanagaster necrorhizus MCA 3950]
MEVILSLAPVPCLAYAYTLLKFIWTTITALDTLKQQTEALASTTATMLSVLDRELKARRVIPEKIVVHLRETENVLKDILAFVSKVKEQGFLKNLYHKEDYAADIDTFHKRILSLMHVFQISSLVNVQEMLAHFKASRKADRAALLGRLRKLENNQMMLMEMIGANHENIMAMISSLQRQMTNGAGGKPEQRFFTRTLRHLSTINKKSVKTEPWTITSYDVEFEKQIDEGGFGKVYKGVWHRKIVAIKVFKSDASPNTEGIHKEIEMWASLRHPNILPFLGANILDDAPFVVTPYLRNGNARKFVEAQPNCDRLKMLTDISHGLLYLHSRKIVHGDLKAVNVLIDDARTAVLCDFGLSQIQEDIMRRASLPNIGSLNWMSPERLAGEPLRSAADIYSFSMTIYELYTLQIPLAHLSDEDFLPMVGYGDVRPQRPESNLITDAIWSVMAQCWIRNPTKRPTAYRVSIMLEQSHTAQPKHRSRLQKRISGDKKEIKDHSRLYKRFFGGKEVTPTTTMYSNDTDYALAIPW